ncbi:MAG: Tat pathway signal sequence domain protein [Povalibacter sp.]
MSDTISRRRFLAASALTSVALPLGVGSASAIGSTVFPSDVANPSSGAWARWLDSERPAISTGATWGMPWPRGKVRHGTSFALRNQAGDSIALQSWPTAYWPDGSLKWTAHAVPAGQAPQGPFEIVPNARAKSPANPLSVTDNSNAIEVDTGVIRCTLPKKGSVVIATVQRDGNEVLRDGRLVLLRQDRPEEHVNEVITHESYESAIERVTVENSGPIRAVVKIEGHHASGGRQWLPFTLRLYFYAGADSVRILHTIIFDGDESKDFIRGIGLRFATVMRDELHDRHVRFSGEENGLFAEAVRGLTGLRRDPGEAVRRAQIAGEATPPQTTFAETVRSRLALIPAFGDWTLLQPNADSFTIRKRTQAGHAWLDANRGHRSAGLGYVGGPSGGAAFGIRNFWQSHPAQLDIRDATSPAAEVTLWVWAPDAPAMDMRFYHDGMGQETFEQQREGLEITYEDYEPGFGTPMGVARTSEIMLWALPATPSRERFAQLADAVRTPATIVATPQTIHESGVFAGTFAPPDRSTPTKARIEAGLDWLFQFYRQQQDERGWYGFWNYGDVMHTYDSDRHVWRYDVGGFAWDNSELATDIWLWLYFLRTGRADVFRFAEAMTRHTGEVDVHHLGRFAPLGSRHNVMHWGCSAKQLRISTALNRRYYYYLTADERVGDLMREQIEAARTLRTISPERKLPGRKEREPVDPQGDYAWLGFGTDWGSLAGAWLTEWERTRDDKSRNRLLASMRSIAAQPKGFFTGSSRLNLRTGEFDISSDPKVSISHLSAAFGLPEVCAELIELLPDKSFEQAWLQYCQLYNASDEEKQKALGAIGPINLIQGHARLTAYAAHKLGDSSLAQRAWRELIGGPHDFGHEGQFTSVLVQGPQVLTPIHEAAEGLSTNSSAQWGLAAIECLAFVPQAAPQS